MADPFTNAFATTAQSSARTPQDPPEDEWPSATRYARHLAAYYEAITDAYDDWSSGVHRRVAARLVEIASPLPGERVLDVGCGTGLVTQLATERVGASGEVVGVDISPRLLEVARLRTSPRVHLMHVPAEVLVFADCTFDVAAMGDTLPYLANPQRALVEALRVLRRRGRLVVSVLRRGLATPAQELYYRQLTELESRHPIVVPKPPGDRRRFGEPEVLSRMLEAAGFVEVDTTALVTGGRAASAREWTELMMGAGPSSHALLSVLGPSVRERFEAELTERMAELGAEEVFRYHHPFTLAAGIRP